SDPDSPTSSRPHQYVIFLHIRPRPPSSTLFPYTTLFRSERLEGRGSAGAGTSQPGARFGFGALRGVAGESVRRAGQGRDHLGVRSEEHTSELQSRGHLVCRLLLEKKKNTTLAGSPVPDSP